MMKNYEKLANAIVLQAVEDYRKELRKSSKNYRNGVKIIEKFFRSEWFKVLTSIDGERLISNLKKELNNER